jgi:hypothetical protein
MATDPKDSIVLREHLNKFQRQIGCPVCGSGDWGVHGPVAIPILDREDGQLSLGMQAMPIMVLRCKVCSFLRQFAWEPIRDKAKGG